MLLLTMMTLASTTTAADVRRRRRRRSETNTVAVSSTTIPLSSFVSWLLILVLVCGTTPSFYVTALPPGFRDEGVADKSGTTCFTFIPQEDDPEKYILLLGRKKGYIHAILEPDTHGIENNDKDVHEVLDIEDQTCSDGERGVSSIIMHPDFRNNRYVYLFYTWDKYGGCTYSIQDGPVNVVARYTVSYDQKGIPLLKNEKVILATSSLPSKVHNGGDLVFGHDGYLYVTLGNGGMAYEYGNAQLSNILLGSLIRITDDGDVPSDNPYVGHPDGVSCNTAQRPGHTLNPEEHCTELYSIGLRNPWRMAMNPNTDADITQLYLNDVGGSTWEEINEVTIPVHNNKITDQTRLNYGYRDREGPCLRGSTTDCTPQQKDGYTDPLHWYQHDDDGGGCITGSTFVPLGTNDPTTHVKLEWPKEYRTHDDTYFFADYVFRKIYWLAPYDDELYCRDDCPQQQPPSSGYTMTEFHATGDLGSPLQLRFGPYQQTLALYYVTWQGDDEYSIRRIVYAGGDTKDDEDDEEEEDNKSPVKAPTKKPTVEPTPKPTRKEVVAPVGEDDDDSNDTTAQQQDDPLLLPKLITYRDYDRPPILQRCEGDCDADEDCAPGLRCYDVETSGGTSIPGCAGISPSKSDYCILDDLTASLDNEELVIGIVEGISSTGDDDEDVDEDDDTARSNNMAPDADIFTEKFVYNINELVIFDASNSSDPDHRSTSKVGPMDGTLDTNLVYEWDFGNGMTSSKPIQKVRYTSPGKYRARLTVTDAIGFFDKTSMELMVGAPPIPTIIAPANGTTFVVGDIFTLLGSAVDADGTVLDPTTNLSWEVRQIHNTHYHPFLDPETIGNNIRISPAPAPEDFHASTNSFLQILLTATDPQTGLTSTVTRDIYPKTKTIRFQTNPPGLSLSLDAFDIQTPPNAAQSLEVVSWINHSISLYVEDQDDLIFESWNNGIRSRKSKFLIEEEDDAAVLVANFRNVAKTSSNFQDPSPPRNDPTSKPTTTAPTMKPTMRPTARPIMQPTLNPTTPPSNKPSERPTYAPTTAEPTKPPTSAPVSLYDQLLLLATVEDKLLYLHATVEDNKKQRQADTSSNHDPTSRNLRQSVSLSKEEEKIGGVKS